MSKYAKEVNKCLLSIRAGDKSAMATLFDITANHLKAIVKCYLANKMYLDDVVLETYERVFLYINSFNPKLDGYNWMCGIAKNLAYSYNGKEMPTCSMDISNGDVALNDLLGDIDTKIDLLLAIKHFDEVDKKILFLRFYLQESLSEIAQQLGVSKVAVHKRLKKICKSIRENY